MDFDYNRKSHEFQKLIIVELLEESQVDNAAFQRARFLALRYKSLVQRSSHHYSEE